MEKIISSTIFGISLFIAVIALPVTLPSNGTSHMPHQWRGFCTSQADENLTSISISCKMTEDVVWDFNHYRNWSATLHNDSLVSLNLECEQEGKVCLPWPYRASHLDTLKVRECMNTCYFADYNRSDIFTTPDKLRILETYGVTKQINVLEYTKHSLETLPKDIECGSLSIERFVNRASKTVFYAPGIPFTDAAVTDMFTESVRERNNLQHECRYELLRVFDVSQNDLAPVTQTYVTFINSRFPELRIVNFSHTSLNTFPSILQAWRQRFEKLEILDLSHNNISRFDLRDMSLMSQDVGRIDLRYNNIREVGDRELNSIKALKKATVDIRGNPFVCSCVMANFSEFLRQNESPKKAGINLNYAYLWDLECTMPPQFQGKKIANLSRHMLCSVDVSHYIANIVVLCVVVVILLVVIFLLARYRKEIRILAFTRFHIVLPCQPVEYFETKVYDAFVSYSHLDYQWVVKTLLPRLEGGECPDGIGGNFRLCLHQRDFAVGAAIADNIVESVESSRHTILVLSKNFLQSEWCIMEFRTAFHQSLLEKKKHLILVLLEDLPKEDLDPDLRRCIQTWTYLHISDKLFWDRLVYSLTDKSKHKTKSSVKQKSMSSNNVTLSPSNGNTFTLPERIQDDDFKMASSSAGFFHLE